MQAALIENPEPHKRVTYLLESRDADGYLHGEYALWHLTSGRRHLHGHFLRGLKHGRWRMWNAQGKLTVDVTYRYGRKQET